MADLDDISVVPEPSAEVLNKRQRLDYEATRKNCLSWLLVFGIDPSKGEGYAHSTVKNRSHRMDQFYRWVWQQEDGYTVDVTHDHADAWMRELAQEDKSNAHKANCQKSVKMLFKWREHEHGREKIFFVFSKIKAFLFGEPSGWPTAVVMFSGAIIFLGMYVYFGVLGDSSTRYELFLVGAFALSGTAESLPKERRRMAGVLRITAMLIPLLMIAALIIAPEMINPR